MMVNLAVLLYRESSLLCLRNAALMSDSCDMKVGDDLTV